MTHYAIRVLGDADGGPVLLGMFHSDASRGAEHAQRTAQVR